MLRHVRDQIYQVDGTHTNHWAARDRATSHSSNTRKAFYILQKVKQLSRGVNSFPAFFSKKSSRVAVAPQCSVF
jgi:hypothetical protein